MSICDCFKNKKNQDEPERVSPRDTVIGKIPFIFVEDQVTVKTRGQYKTKTGQPKGLIVHYTAGRDNPIGTLKSLAKRGLGCLIMGKDGRIYRSHSQELDEVAYHAGSSMIYKTKGLSFYCMGMEMCNAGKLDLESDGHYSWFGTRIPGENVRSVNGNGYKIAGDYEKYTTEQEQSLFDFCIWQLKTNPEFSVDWVLGHDEVCVPMGRKSDPGGSLSMSMPNFRQKLRNAMK